MKKNILLPLSILFILACCSKKSEFPIEKPDHDPIDSLFITNNGWRTKDLEVVFNGKLYHSDHLTTARFFNDLVLKKDKKFYAIQDYITFLIGSWSIDNKSIKIIDDRKFNPFYPDPIYIPISNMTDSTIKLEIRKKFTYSIEAHGSNFLDREAANASSSILLGNGIDYNTLKSTPIDVYIILGIEKE